MSEQHSLPLQGIRIVSFTQLLQGPSGVQILADLGADVVKVERPGVGAWERNWSGGEAYKGGQSLFHLSVNRNQRGMTANLKSEAGREVLLKLLDRADLMVENYRPGVLEKAGFGYEDLKKRNPRLIYISCSGYGPSGPYRERPGQDLLAQALSGLASVTGRGDDPPTPAGTPLVDQHAAVLLALGAMVALFGRETSGRGQKIDVNLLDAALDLQIEPLVYLLNGFRFSRRSRSGVATPFHPPPYGIYATSDGYIALSLTPAEKLAQVLDCEQLAKWKDKERFQHREEMNEIICERMRRKSTEAWLEHFRKHDVWSGPVRTYDDLLDDPQVRHNQVFQEFDQPGAGPIRVLRHPITYSEAKPSVRKRPPLLGEHTDEILAELDYSDEEIVHLHEIGAV